MVTRPKRIGLLLPATNTVVEPDFVRALPAGVTLHSERLWVEEHPSEGRARQRMVGEIDRAARYLAQARVDVIALAVLTDSTPTGESASEMEHRVGSAVGIPVVRTSPAAVMALRALGAGLVCLASPYDEEFTAGLKTMLEANGLIVTNAASEPRLALAGDLAVQEQRPEDILDFASRVCPPEADAVFMPCNSWRSAEIVEELERRTNAVVVTASLATLWRCLKVAGVAEAVSGCGRLLTDMPAVPA